MRTIAKAGGKAKCKDRRRRAAAGAKPVYGRKKVDPPARVTTT